MQSLKTFSRKQLQDPELRKEYEALPPERAVVQAIIGARHRAQIIQKGLSERTGITQGDISKLENQDQM